MFLGYSGTLVSLVVSSFVDLKKRLSPLDQEEDDSNLFSTSEK